MGLDADRSSSATSAKPTLSMNLRKRKNPSKAAVCPDPFFLPNLLDGFDEKKYGKVAEDIRRLCDMKRRILNPYIRLPSMRIDTKRNKSMKRENLVKPPPIVIIDSDDELPKTAAIDEDYVGTDPNLINIIPEAIVRDKGGDFLVTDDIIILEDDDCILLEDNWAGKPMAVVGGSQGSNSVRERLQKIRPVAAEFNVKGSTDAADDGLAGIHAEEEILAGESHKMGVVGDSFGNKDMNMQKRDREIALADKCCVGAHHGVNVADCDLGDDSRDNIGEGNNSDIAASPQTNDVGYSAGNSTDSGDGRHWVEDKEDDLSDIWKQMAFCLESSKDTSENTLASESAEEQGDDCDHSFIHKDDVGEVCRVCGLIQRDIRSIIEVVYNKPKRSTRTYMHDSHNTKNGETSLALSHSQSSSADCLVPKISVHPRHQKQMRPHQIEGFNFLCDNLVTDDPGGCILAHAPGSGKTFLVISFMQSFMALYPHARPLIVLPRGIIESWKREFILWQVENIPLLDFYSAKAESRAQQVEVLRKWVGERSILLLGYKQFSTIICDLKNNKILAECQEILLKVPTVLVLDEGHTSRNEDTDVLQSLARVETPRKVVLSGTLFQNHVKEVFNILNLVRPKFLKLPNSWEIVNRIMSKVEMPSVRKHMKMGNELAFFDGVEYTLQKSDNSSAKVSVIKDLREMTHQVLHYHKANFQGELPGLLEFTVMLNLNTLQRDEVKRLRKLDKFKQISLGSALYLHPNLLAFSQKYPSNGERGLGFEYKKIDEMLQNINVQDGVKMNFFLNMLRLCESTGEKLLVFSQYILPLKALERLLGEMKGWSLGKQMFAITGDSSTEQREWSMERFNNSSDAKVFFGSIKACGEGISLVGASRVLILDVHLNPSVTQQAIARAYRPGQKKKVYAYRLVATDSPEEEDYTTCVRKELISKMWFEWNEGSDCRDFGFKLVDVDDSGDAFLETTKMREDIKALYIRYGAFQLLSLSLLVGQVTRYKFSRQVWIPIGGL